MVKLYLCLNRGFTQFLTHVKLCPKVSPWWNSFLLSPKDFMQKVEFCWCGVVFNLHETHVKPDEGGLIRDPSPSTRAPRRPGVRDRARPWWSVYFARDPATTGQTPFSAGVGRIGANHPCLCAVVWFELLSAWLAMYFRKKTQSRADGACVCRWINSQTSNRFRFDQIQLRVQQKGNPFLDLLMGG
jgi:hypothetical protein